MSIFLGLVESVAQLIGGTPTARCETCKEQFDSWNNLGAFIPGEGRYWCQPCVWREDGKEPAR